MAKKSATSAAPVISVDPTPKSLGEIAHDAGAAAGGWARQWCRMGRGDRAEWESLALAVAAAVREQVCAEIEAADDEASLNDYMLDSNDCIRVIRGSWGTTTGPTPESHKTGGASQTNRFALVGLNGFYWRRGFDRDERNWTPKVELAATWLDQDRAESVRYKCFQVFCLTGHVTEAATLKVVPV